MNSYGDKLYCLGNMYEIAARGHSKDPVKEMEILLDKYSLEKDNLIRSLQVQITNFKKQEKLWRINHADNGRTIGVQELDLQKLRLENTKLKESIPFKTGDKYYGKGDFIDTMMNVTKDSFIDPKTYKRYLSEVCERLVDSAKFIKSQGECRLNVEKRENKKLRDKINDLKEELKDKDNALTKKRVALETLHNKSNAKNREFIKKNEVLRSEIQRLHNRNDYINNYNHSTLNFDVEPLVDPLKRKDWNVNPASTEKPPIGIMPKTIWIVKRIDELLECINRYQEAGRGPGKSDSTYALFAKWTKEVMDLKTILDNDK